ncbi:MAG TPA: hypothetical protein VFA10_14850 [Ktedonobacteraceae bacterium]|nr:hypothetical protein [Ktedonobacteraceae bacterium]
MPVSHLLSNIATLSDASFTITVSQIIYIAIAAIVGVLAEFIVGWRLPFGIIGAIIAALVGIWLLTNVVQVNIPGDFTIAGQPIPIIRALLGAMIVVGLWHLLTYSSWSRRDRYYRRRRDRY